MKWPFVTRKEYERDMSNLQEIITRLQLENDSLWKFHSKFANKGHWTKQKRVKGRFSK